MTADTVFTRLRQRPFVPFKIILSSGTSYDVLHPEMLNVAKTGMFIAIYDRKQTPSPDEIPVRFALASYLHVAATEDLPVPTATAS